MNSLKHLLKRLKRLLFVCLKIDWFYKSILLLCLQSVICGICPNLNAIKPCTCDTLTIRCYANIEFDLDEVFETIAFGRNEIEKSFETLELSSYRLTELEDSIFRGVTFKTIRLLHCQNLDCVAPTAFVGMEKTLTNFFSFDTSFSNNSNKSECNLFNALRRLHSLRSINISDSRIREIPADAFHDTNSVLNQMTTIDISGGEGGEITRIGRNAFSTLKNLRYLDLSSHKITQIDSFGFAFRETSTEKLTINLENNLLTEDSFEVESLEVNGRVTTLMLGANPKLLVLKESVFRSFLISSGNPNPNSYNSIDLRGTPIVCNHKNLWILENKYQIQHKIQNFLSMDTGFDYWRHTKQQCNKT